MNRMMSRADYVHTLNTIISRDTPKVEFQAGAYELFARRHRGSFPVYLDRDPRVFWSKGWKGCSFGCGCRMTDPIELIAFRNVKDGVVTSGWRCTL